MKSMNLVIIRDIAAYWFNILFLIDLTEARYNFVYFTVAFIVSHLPTVQYEF